MSEPLSTTGQAMPASESFLFKQCEDQLKNVAGDAHYHHLMDDVIVGGKMKYVDGHIEVPTRPGLGVELDREKLSRYSELYKQLGGSNNDRDPSRPEW